MGNLRLEIVTPYGNVFSGEVSSVYVPTRSGEIGVLPGHCDLLFLLNPGVIEINLEDDKKELVAVNWGYGDINNNVLSILADGAVSVGEGGGVVASNLEEAKSLLQGASSDINIMSSAIKKIQDAK